MNQAYLFNKGLNYQSYNMLGSRPSVNAQGEPGYRFAVWAPHAIRVSVVGEFNQWQPGQNDLQEYGTTGIWVGFIPDLEQWELYKFAIYTNQHEWILKADPYARHSETRPGTASILYDPDDYTWQDDDYMANRVDAYFLKPLNIYEVHLGSWRRYPDGSCYNYRDIAPQLADYVVDMGYNAIELMPIMEYPLDASWGYQVTGYYSVTSRYGTPADLKFFVDHMHQRDIHVILDWVPGHFPRDAFGLARFDGECLYEYADTRKGEHREWGTLVFDYSKSEVRSFLLSNAFFWLNEFHFDGLRVDAVSSMLYLDYNRREYVPNEYGGNENLEALSFLKELNQLVRENFPGVMMIAEESTSFPYITTGVDRGGLGFTHKWNMGWMNDTLNYSSLDHIFRPYHHHEMTFSMMYAFSERFILPFSHDEVVHGKKTILGRMPGDYWRQFANLRTLYMYQMAHPGAKLNFMGNELAAYTEWRFYEELEWFMLEYPSHRQIQSFVRELNHFYLDHPALWEIDDTWDGFEWLQADDFKNSVLAFARINYLRDSIIVAVFNLTPAVFEEYLLTVPEAGDYRLVMNSDDPKHGGSNFLERSTPDYILTAEEVSPDEDEAESAEKTKNESRRVISDTGAEKAAKRTVNENREATKALAVNYRLNLKLPPLCGLYFEWRADGRTGSDQKSR